MTKTLYDYVYALCICLFIHFHRVILFAFKSSDSLIDVPYSDVHFLILNNPISSPFYGPFIRRIEFTGDGGR